MKSQSVGLHVQFRRARKFRGRAQYTFGRTMNYADGTDDLPPDSRALALEWGRAAFDRPHRASLLGSWSLPSSLTLGVIATVASGRPYEWTTGRDLNGDGLAIERPAGVRRNALRTPATQTVDVRLSRQFRPGGEKSKWSATAAVDAFNLLNRVNFTRIGGNESSLLFRQPLSSAAARRLQLSVRVSF